MPTATSGNSQLKYILITNRRATHLLREEDTVRTVGNGFFCSPLARRIAIDHGAQLTNLATPGRLLV